ncbi:unnamed protein product [Thelazia callipaeda]|uniref:Uncharacterized protein n=1 Tax=Thelazia callipaeda TaxID=103827 RepID=A0A0N5D6H5_THECL|nr:unnamed protein product [Thelazia callipaeda]
MHLKLTLSLESSWKGSESDAKRLEGSLVQLKISCNNAITDFYCIAFRIAGVHVNVNLAYRLSDMHWNRIELIICLLLTALLFITSFGGAALWKVCWKNKKSKLISTMQMQFLYHMKQQQVHMQEQIASIKANIDRQPSLDSKDDQCTSTAGIQKKKLYFSADFFEPELMANPPVLAVQFIYELRKMIDVAKDRIRMKRHVPTLKTISEDNEVDEYFEFPRIESETNKCSDEPSPKSLNSPDSGCDSLSDDDIQNHQMLAQGHEEEQFEESKPIEGAEERWNEMRIERVEKVDGNKEPNFGHQHVYQPSLLPTRIPIDGTLLPRSVTKTAHVSRIPTIVSPRMVNLMSPASRPLPKLVSIARVKRTHSNRNNGTHTMIENAGSAALSKLPYLTLKKREPPNLERIINNVPPPLPEITPPNTSSLTPCRPRFYAARRRAYTVFPNNDLMLKKSLSRRLKQQQRCTATNAVAVQTSLSSQSPTNPKS